MSARLRYELIAANYGAQYSNDIPDEFKKQVSRWLNTHGLDETAYICLELFLLHIKLHKRLADKLVYCRSLFDKQWRYFMKQSIEANHLRTLLYNHLERIDKAQSWGEEHGKPSFTAFCQLAADYNIPILETFMTSWRSFTDPKSYQILIEKFGASISREHFDLYSTKYPDRTNVIEYLRSVLPLSERKKTVVVPALSLDESIRELPLELIDIIAGYVTGY